MTLTILPTEFAPAERASDQEIRTQAQYFDDLALLRKFFDAIPNIFLILNEYRQIIFANRALLELLDLKDEDTIYGLRPGEVFGCVHAIESNGQCGTTEFCKTCGAVKAILSSLRGQESVQECRIMREVGEALDLRVWATPLSLGNKQFSIFAIDDISHEKRRRALERIFFHDILNLAAGLWGYVELLQKATAEELDPIKSSIYQLAQRLIEEITAQRELSAAESNELGVYPNPLNSIYLLEEVAGLYRSYKEIETCRIEISSRAQAVEFISDETLLRRVLGNMTKNALEASAPSETVTLGCELKEEQVEFWVHNPAYMPRPVQLQVFQRSFSTKGLGRGLGTYSMKLLTERYLNGSVSFTSSEEEGTTFFARYPLILEKNEHANNDVPPS
jgi:signal transduction histidine kinase